jgi:hypothetical protein
MTAIVCDACKKAIPAATRGVNYVSLLDKELCESCADELLDTTKQQMKPRRPYTFKDYNEFLVRNLGHMTK